MGRKQYEMTEEEYQEIIEISTRPRPVMLVGGVDMSKGPLIAANAFWRKLSKRLGFVWDTVKPAPGGGNMRIFTAEERIEDEKEA